MARKKLTWREKLQDSKGHPTVGPVSGKMSQRWGTGTMVIPAPLEVGGSAVEPDLLGSHDALRGAFAFEAHLDRAIGQVTRSFKANGLEGEGGAHALFAVHKNRAAMM